MTDSEAQIPKLKAQKKKQFKNRQEAVRHLYTTISESLNQISIAVGEVAKYADDDLPRSKVTFTPTTEQLDYVREYMMSNPKPEIQKILENMEGPKPTRDFMKKMVASFQNSSFLEDEIPEEEPIDFELEMDLLQEKDEDVEDESVEE